MNKDKEKWCDYDYVIDLIERKGYKSETDIDNLAHMIIIHYDGYLDDEGESFYAIEDKREYPENLMIHIDDVEIYVEENGGFKEFDYYC